MRSSLLAEVVEPGLGVGAGLIALGLLLVAGIVLGLHLTLNMWLRPILTSLAHPKGGFFVRTALLPLVLLAKGVLAIEKKVDSLLSHWAYAHLTQLARWFSAQALVALHGAAGIIDGPEKILESLGILRHHTLPREITRKTQPLDRRVRHATAVAHGADVLGRDTRREAFKGIDNLGVRLNHKFTRLFHGIDEFVRTRVWPRVLAGERAIAVTIPGEFSRLRLRVSRLEKLLGLAALAGLVVKVLARRFPWIFCRNVDKLGRAVCGLNQNELNAILGLLAGAFLIADIRTLARLAESLEDEVAGEVKRLLSA